jgi:hypothetical protein
MTIEPTGRSVGTPSPRRETDATPIDRRRLLQLGGITVSAAAVLAACGIESDTDPGRVGVAPVPTALPDYLVDDAVLLRTATSVELTIADIYRSVLDQQVLEPEWERLMIRLTELHEQAATEMQRLTEEAGGEPWTCTNPWMVDRLVEPIVDAMARSPEDLAFNAINTAVAFENLSAANNQSLAATLTEGSQRLALGLAAAQSARNAATIVIRQRGADGYVNPAPNGDTEFDERGAVVNYAVPGPFGSLAAIELVIVAPDTEGGPDDFALQTPAENAYVYNELEPSC